MPDVTITLLKGDMLRAIESKFEAGPSDKEAQELRYLRDKILTYAPMLYEEYSWLVELVANWRAGLVLEEHGLHHLKQAISMQAYGRKKHPTHVAGHQKCGICHPVQKNKTARGREANRREIEENMRIVEETREEMITRWEKQGRLDPNCTLCKEFYDYDGRPCSVFAPNHQPSINCESGKHPHCTCDICF